MHTCLKEISIFKTDASLGVLPQVRQAETTAMLAKSAVNVMRIIGNMSEERVAATACEAIGEI